jgi:type III secretion protein Q
MNQALSLPALAAQGIPLLNQLFRLSQQIFSLGFLPAPLIPDFAPLAPTAKTKLVLNWNGFPIYLYLDTSINALARTLLPQDMTLSSLGEDIALALFEKALLANYRQLLNSPLHLQKVEDTHTLPENCYVLQWQPEHTTLRGQLCIEQDKAAAFIHTLTQALAPIVAEHPAPTPFPALPIPVRLQLGELNLSLAEIKTLKENDLLLPEKSYFSDGVMHLHLTTSLGFTVKIEDSTCIVMTPLESYRAHMDNNENDFDDDFKRFLEDIPETSYGTEDLAEDDYHEEEEEETHEDASALSTDHEYATGLDDVNIHLTFDVGHLELPLGELASITPGYTFNLAKSIHKAVTIRANGTAIGTGELVDIEGTIGVSIVALHQRGKG